MKITDPNYEPRVGDVYVLGAGDTTEKYEVVQSCWPYPHLRFSPAIGGLSRWYYVRNSFLRHLVKCGAAYWESYSEREAGASREEVGCTCAVEEGEFCSYL